MVAMNFTKPCPLFSDIIDVVQESWEIAEINAASAKKFESYDDAIYSFECIDGSKYLAKIYNASNTHDPSKLLGLSKMLRTVVKNLQVPLSVPTSLPLSLSKEGNTGDDLAVIDDCAVLDGTKRKCYARLFHFINGKILNCCETHSTVYGTYVLYNIHSL